MSKVWQIFIVSQMAKLFSKRSNITFKHAVICASKKQIGIGQIFSWVLDHFIAS